MGYRFTRDEDDRFHQAYAFLCASKHATFKDTEFEATRMTLGDLPIEAVEEAAKNLAKEPGEWMPSAGDWYRLADGIALKALTEASSSSVGQLTASRHLENEEEQATRLSRDAFVSQYEDLSGQTLPADHVWKLQDVRVSGYGCATGQDTGWQTHPCTKSAPCRTCQARRFFYPHDYVDRCRCFQTNPVLQAARAHVRHREHGKQPRRGR